jgi:hypothetical protein
LLFTTSFGGAMDPNLLTPAAAFAAALRAFLPVSLFGVNVRQHGLCRIFPGVDVFSGLFITAIRNWSGSS